MGLTGIIRNTFYDIPKDICLHLERKGTPQILKEWSQDEGVYKVATLAEWVLPLIHPRFNQPDDLLMTHLQTTRLFFVGTRFIKTLKEHFVHEHKPKLLLPKKQHISAYFLALGHLIEAYNVGKKLGLINQIPFFSNLASQLSSYSIFRWPVLNLIPSQPKAFFMGVGSVIALLELWPGIKKYKPDHLRSDKKAPSSPAPLPWLKGINYLGKIVRNMGGRSYNRSPWYQAAYGVGVISSLLAYSIKFN